MSTSFTLLLLFLISCIFTGMFLYTRVQKPQLYLLYFGLFLSTIAVNLMGVWKVTTPAYLTELVKYYSYGASSFFLLFYEQIFGEGWRKIHKRLWQIHFVCCVIIMVFSLTSVLSLEDSYLPYSWFNIMTIGYITVSTIKQATSGHNDAKTLSIGLVGFIVTVLIDISTAMKVNSYSPTSSTIWGLLFFISCLIFIMFRRFKEKGSDFLYDPFSFPHHPVMLKMKADSLMMHTLKNELHRLLYLNERNQSLLQSLSGITKDKLGENFITMEESLHHMNNMMQALKKTDDLKIKTTTTSLNDLIQQVIDSLVVPKEIHWEINMASEVIIEADPLHLKECLINILSNSIEAILHKQGNIKVHLYQTKKHAFVEVCDNGTGIDQAHVSDVMTPLFTTKKTAAHYGIGLYYVYLVVTQHGGTFLIPKTELGKGTTVQIQLPFLKKSYVRSFGRNGKYQGFASRG